MGGAVQTPSHHFLALSAFPVPLLGSSAWVPSLPLYSPMSLFSTFYAEVSASRPPCSPQTLWLHGHFTCQVLGALIFRNVRLTGQRLILEECEEELCMHCLAPPYLWSGRLHAVVHLRVCTGNTTEWSVRRRLQPRPCICVDYWADSSFLLLSVTNLTLTSSLFESNLQLTSLDNYAIFVEVNDFASLTFEACVFRNSMHTFFFTACETFSLEIQSCRFEGDLSLSSSGYLHLWSRSLGKVHIFDSVFRNISSRSSLHSDLQFPLQRARIQWHYIRQYLHLSST